MPYFFRELFANGEDGQTKLLFSRPFDTVQHFYNFMNNVNMEKKKFSSPLQGFNKIFSLESSLSASLSFMFLNNDKGNNVNISENFYFFRVEEDCRL